ncbi:MAG: hypothetical protein O2913_04385 [Chloroflexi bacterium]|nr:hypothetical protein [Chloroflexota bacterium]
MLNQSIFAERVRASAFGYWRSGLLLGAGILLILGCTTAVPVEVDNDNSVPTDTPTPTASQQPSADGGGPTETTDSGTTTLRPLPNTDESSARRIPDDPAPDLSKLLPKNTLGLVMAVNGGSSSSTLKTIVQNPGSGAVEGVASIKLESSSKSVVLYLPDTGESTVINSYSSPSYAPHFKRPYTVDDRLYVSDKYTNGGAMTITEYATDDLSRAAEWGTQTDAIDPEYAVAGEQVYFRTDSEEQWSMSRGFYNAAGNYVTSPFSSQWESKEMETPELRFALVSGGETLYGAKLPSENDPITGVFLVDPNTGQPNENYLTAFEIEDWDDYHPSSWRNVVIEDGTAYWAGFRGGPAAYTVEILAANLVDPDVFNVYEFEVPATGKEITGFNSSIDADGGYVLIKPFYEGGDRTKLLLYNTALEAAEIFETGFDITDAQLIFIEG